MPEEGVYFVKPASSDPIAAALICSGVSKSGSPAPKPITSWPSAFMALALLSMERVKDGVSSWTRVEGSIKGNFRICGNGERELKHVQRRQASLLRINLDKNFQSGI